MEDMWAHRKPPHTLDWGELSSSAAGAGDDANKEVPSQTNGVAAATTEKDQARIKDQRKLSLKDSFDLFVDAYVHDTHTNCDLSNSLTASDFLGHGSCIGSTA